jgi:transposase-like protein
MRTDYRQVITEDEPTLRRVERRVRGRPTAVRVQALRLLKSGTARSLAACATLVGHSPRQVARWWATYRQEGLDGLLREPTYPGKTPRLTMEARADVAAVMAVAQAQDQTQDRPPPACAGRCGGAGGVSRRVS